MQMERREASLVSKGEVRGWEGGGVTEFWLRGRGAVDLFESMCALTTAQTRFLLY
jgi:hypothetical protein